MPILACSRHPKARGARVVFTALHGTGRLTVLPVLQEADSKPVGTHTGRV